MIASRQDAGRRVVSLGITNGVGLPAFRPSLAYYEAIAGHGFREISSRRSEFLRPHIRAQ